MTLTLDSDGGIMWDGDSFGFRICLDEYIIGSGFRSDEGIIAVSEMKVSLVLVIGEMGVSVRVG